jgi:hypothetical protein
MLTWVWALSSPLPPVCPEVPCAADQCLHMLHQWKVLPLMFCFISGSPDFGSMSFQLFLISPCFAYILLVSVAIALVLVSFQLGTVLSPMPNFSTIETRFVLLLWVSGLLHKCHDLSLVIISVVDLLSPNLDSTAFFAGIHSSLFSRLM